MTPYEHSTIDNHSLCSTAITDKSTMEIKKVTFMHADIIEFEPTVYTATVSSDGVPIGMSLNVRRRKRRRLDSYEDEQEMFRIDRQEYMEQGYLEPDERLDILENAGHNLSTIGQIELDICQINRERWESNEYDTLYQLGLGETPMLDEDEDIDIAMIEHSPEPNDGYSQDDCNDSIYTSYNVLEDAEMHFAMEEIDCYETHNYEAAFRMDYSSGCIVGLDTDHCDNNSQLPYIDIEDTSDIDILESTSSCDGVELGSSPTDVTNTPDVMNSCLSRCDRNPNEMSNVSVAVSV